jgi:hypothetical protein
MRDGQLFQIGPPLPPIRETWAAAEGAFLFLARLSLDRL